MAVGDIVPLTGEWFEETLTSASPDLLRTMIREMAQRMMDAEVECLCGAGYGEVSSERVNSRNGYRRREWDARAGTVELAIPKLRSGSYSARLSRNYGSGSETCSSELPAVVARATGDWMGGLTRGDRPLGLCLPKTSSGLVSEAADVRSRREAGLLSGLAAQAA